MAKIFNNIAVKPLLAIAMASASLIFSPSSVVADLGIGWFVNHYRSWLGFALVVSFTYLCAHAIIFLAHKLRDIFISRMLRKGRIKSLKRLTPEEKLRLLPYIIDQKASTYHSINDGVINGLIAKNILFRSSNIGTMHSFPFNIQPWAREELEKNPSLLTEERTGPNHITSSSLPL